MSLIQNVQAGLHQNALLELQTNQEEYAYLDIGYPGEREINGPRIAFRRFQEGKGWRFLIHADGGDPIVSVEIPDHTEQQDFTVVIEEEPCTPPSMVKFVKA